MIRKLNWDSDFFNLSIGRIDIQNLSEFNLVSDSELKKYDLVYVFSKEEIGWDIPLMDAKVTFYKKSEKHEIYNSIEIFDENKHSFEQLIELVYLSGHDSRFLKDPIFSELKFKKLYKKWIENSINDNSIIVLVYYDESKKLILGFVTINISSPKSTIGLIAVSPSAQNLGIGKKLVRAAENQLNSNSIIQVAT